MLGDVDDVTLGRLLDDVAAGRLSPASAATALSRLPFADLGHARIDHHRALRQGLPEAVYAPGKQLEHLVAIVDELLAHGTGPVLVTRVNDEQAEAVLKANPDGDRHGSTLVWRARPVPASAGPRVIVASAGTADLSVAEECATTLRSYGIAARLLTDVGVAGLHRLLPRVDELVDADVVVTIAGMEGALASVIAGLTARPVIAVPTSVGYGASLEGVTALLAMHASCAPGVTVVGIDNGYGAACAVCRILATSRSTAPAGPPA
jgi:NCAIR mutase (PurE)-related protein